MSSTGLFKVNHIRLYSVVLALITVPMITVICHAVLWIRIRIKLKGRIRIRIKVISWIRIRIRFTLQMTSQNAWNMSLFEHFFKLLSPYLEARIRIRIKGNSYLRSRIRIKMISWIRIRIKVITESGSASICRRQAKMFGI